ncbi:MAG: histidine phosphatase family protein [Elusimicrobiales bacterium]|nr:histidine phosphatase family protein [Elusimicrobiales bacterium]
MHLVIVRHGEALPKSENGSDFSRHLSDDGRLAVKKAAENLKMSGFKFDFILSSPFVRTIETAEIFSFIMNISFENIISSDMFKMDTPVTKTYEFLDLYKNNRIIVISHMPLVSDLIYKLIKKDIYFKPASYVYLIKTGDKFEIFSKYNL